MKTFFTVLIAGHGLVHLIGFLRAFNMMDGKNFSIPVSKPMGLLWLLTFILFEAVALMMFYNYKQWWIIGSIAVVISQFLIIWYWHDAKWGTFVNIVILFVIVVDFGSWHFRRTFNREVATNLQVTTGLRQDLLLEDDIIALPVPVQKYIRYCGAIGKPKVENFKVEFTGQIRKNEESPWMPLHSVQYNFLESSTRLFFMDATMMKLPVSGFHSFRNGTASMDIRLFSMIPVQYQEGKEMGIAETVTFFNDMCCMAPATLIDKRIKWLETNGNKVVAEFTNNNITISAVLTFNDEGQLTNFESNDRFAADDELGMRKLPWETPMSNYRDINGYHLSGHGDAVYIYPEGKLTYGEFNLTNVEYNCTQISI